MIVKTEVKEAGDSSCGCGTRAPRKPEAITPVQVMTQKRYQEEKGKPPTPTQQRAPAKKAPKEEGKIKKFFKKLLNFPEEEPAKPAREVALGGLTIKLKDPAQRAALRERGAVRFMGEVYTLEEPAELERERTAQEDEVTARELLLYIDNEYDLYQQEQSIFKNLVTKIAQGKYDRELAPKLFMYLVDRGAKKYHKEFGSTYPPWHVLFRRRCGWK